MPRTPYARSWTVAVSALAIMGLAACSGGEPTDSATDAPDGAVEVTGTDELTFDPEQLTVDAGEVTFALSAEAGVAHNLVLELEDEEQRVATAEPGATAVGTVTLEPGTYTYFCSIPGHRSAGMEGTVEVES